MQFLRGVAWVTFAVAISSPWCFGQSGLPAVPPISDAKSTNPPEIERRTNVSLPLRTKPGFQVEQVYAVPRDKEGSWVALTVDHRGRLIVSDQAGGLYRITLRPGTAAIVEPIRGPVGHAHGLLYAFDSLYAVVSEKEYDGPGLYRIRDRDGDDQFDEVKLLIRLEGTGEHGPHSVILGPDGRSLYVCAGNKTRLPAATIQSRVPRHWGEDDLLPRIWGPLGSEAGTPAPGGWIARTDPDGKNWELLAIGLRNPFDLAFSREGELFTADADAEFDVGTPWYQPTRVLHVVSGVDFGWRSGSGKWPPYFADTLPPVVELGPGSPTGVTFGYGAKFPAPYENALYVCDWSYGRVFAVHLSPAGASYTGAVEEFLSGTPLPIVDLVVNQVDGAMYFTLGGRGTTSGLYRLRYAPEAERPSETKVDANRHVLRRRLESWHRSGAPSDAPGDAPGDAIDFAWTHLGDDDRFVRHAARLVLEHTSPATWSRRALDERRSDECLSALLALARVGDKTLLPQIIASLDRLAWNSLDRDQRLLLARCYEVALCRSASSEWMSANAAACQLTRRRLESVFPSGDYLIDAEVCKLLVYLRSERVTERSVELLSAAASRQEQLRYALPLRHQLLGWTPDLRRQYFGWLQRAGTWSGGQSFSKYIETIGRDALAAVAPGERAEFAALLVRGDEPSGPAPPARAFVRQWSLTDFEPIGAENLRDRDRHRGRQLFAAGNCFACHRVSADGGAMGPDLTAAGRRFTPRDLLEAIILPDKVISDQFAATTLVLQDGRVLTGRIVNQAREELMIQTDMLQPANLDRIARGTIEQLQVSKSSMMPSGLVDTFTEDEILDLLAFLSDGSRW